ncbi:hypothetical protein RB195_014839 [Necator americanus]|uniref:GP-PDE domain-containing protein n=1 Tax=Necator americanus TaxID=51031 RepID=A0ABR1E228_NECAM
MIACAAAWQILVLVILTVLLERVELLLRIIASIPVLLTVFFYLFKNENVKAKHKKIFFTGLKVGGHRGSPKEAPENSIAGFKKAKEAKCTFVEFDIHLSSDFVPVLMHDNTTGRTSRREAVVSETSLQHIKDISLKSVRGVKDHIPTLFEAVEWCRENKMRMIFDVKDANKKMMESLTKLIKTKNLYDIVIVSSFNAKVPYIIKKIDKNILTGFTHRSGYMSYEDDSRSTRFHTTIYFFFYRIVDDLIELGIRSFLLPLFLGVDMLLLHHNNINGYLVEDSRLYGIQVLAWTVNDKITADFLHSINVPFLTDFPHLIT